MPNEEHRRIVPHSNRCTEALVRDVLFAVKRYYLLHTESNQLNEAKVMRPLTFEAQELHMHQTTLRRKSRAEPFRGSLDIIYTSMFLTPLDWKNLLTACHMGLN